MNSFLFNISLVLLGSMAITQFVTDCLCDYVAFTDVDALFNTLIKNLKFFKYFYRNHVFQYIYFGIFVLSFFYMICQLCKKQKIVRDNNKSLIIEEKEKKKNKKNKKKLDEKIKVDEKINQKNNKDKDKDKDKETENSDSFDKINKKKKNSNISEEKLDVDENNINNDNNNNNEANSFENDDF